MRCVWCNVATQTRVCHDCAKPRGIEAMELCLSCWDLWHMHGKARSHRRSQAKSWFSSADSGIVQQTVEEKINTLHKALDDEKSDTPTVKPATETQDPVQEEADKKLAQLQQELDGSTDDATETATDEPFAQANIESPAVIEIPDDVPVNQDIKSQLDAMCAIEDAVQCTSIGNCHQESCLSMLQHIEHEVACSPLCSALNEITNHLTDCKLDRNSCYVCLHAQQRKLMNQIVNYSFWISQPPTEFNFPSIESFKFDMGLRRHEARFQLRQVQAFLVALHAPVYTPPALRLHYTSLPEPESWHFVPPNDPISKHIFQVELMPVSWWNECISVCVEIAKVTLQKSRSDMEIHITHVTQGKMCDHYLCTSIYQHASHRKQCKRDICPYCQLLKILAHKTQWENTTKYLDEIIAQVRQVVNDQPADAQTQLKSLRESYNINILKQRTEHEHLLEYSQTLQYLVQDHTPINIPSLNEFL